ncbi:hypothetical protein D918_01610 [Trichuris suis]|nr:hypothetical protein D918_01610 [Trichuris suis]
MESTGRAYGAGMAGAGFDPVKLVKTPRFVLRVVCAKLCIFANVFWLSYLRRVVEHRAVNCFGRVFPENILLTLLVKIAIRVGPFTI